MIKRFNIALISFLFAVNAFASVADSLGLDPVDGAYLRQCQKRDSVLIADQLEYGVVLEKVQKGTGLALPDFSAGLGDSLLVLVRDWTIDTLKVRKQGKNQPELLDLRPSIILTSFDEGKFELPPILVQRNIPNGDIDSLLFKALETEFKTIPVDTATFEIHDIKGQIRYPITFKELLPYILGALALIGLIVLIVFLVKKYRNKIDGVGKSSEPAHIVALRKLDKFRGDKLWVSDKQKGFYSGVTDTLREYIDSRYGIPAMEMTTKEIFDNLKSQELSPDLFIEAKDLFERADFVKFAKFVVDNDENAKAVPVAVRFVTQTYQVELEKETGEGEPQ